MPDYTPVMTYVEKGNEMTSVSSLVTNNRPKYKDNSQILVDGEIRTLMISIRMCSLPMTLQGVQIRGDARMK